MNSKQVSVVIPVHNRGNILRNTLLSLNRQTYPKTRYQVIVVDDGSTDGTMDLINRYSFENFAVISHGTNKGAPAARNTGIQHAEGDLIVFCDSDFILPSTFIESHVKEHADKQNYAVSGMGHWHFIYSYEFYDKWSEFQEELLQEKWRDPFIRERLNSVLDPHLLLEEEVVQETYTPFIFRPKLQFVNMFEEIILQHGLMLEGFHLPWLTFCTGNVSISKHCLTELGGFDEQFFPLGYDDWELGYRFFLEGGKFCFSTAAEAFQQMTPANHGRGQIAARNYQKFYQKHPDFAVLLLALDLKQAVPYTALSKILAQHDSLQAMGEPYRQLSESFENMLQMLAAGQTPPYKQAPALKNITSSRGVLSEEYASLLKSSKLAEWSTAFTKLLY